MYAIKNWLGEFYLGYLDGKHRWVKPERKMHRKFDSFEDAQQCCISNAIDWRITGQDAEVIEIEEHVYIVSAVEDVVVTGRSDFDGGIVKTKITAAKETVLGVFLSQEAAMKAIVELVTGGLSSTFHDSEIVLLSEAANRGLRVQKIKLGGNLDERLEPVQLELKAR